MVSAMAMGMALLGHRTDVPWQSVVPSAMATCKKIAILSKLEMEYGDLKCTPFHCRFTLAYCAGTDYLLVLKHEEGTRKKLKV
jgi:hypothetical protein